MSMRIEHAQNNRVNDRCSGAMSVTVRQLVLLLLVASNLSAVVGDCFNEPPNNSSYENCASCYQTFANALINIADNKYNLSRAFFPTNLAPPVQVEVKWQEAEDGRYSTTLYWVAGGFFAFQPVNLFVYRSLLFSPPTFRKTSLTLFLPRECFSTGQNAQENTTNYQFFVFATQRLMGYATSQEAIPDEDNSHVGIAVSNTTDNNNYILINSNGIIIAAYGLPFLIFVVIILVTFVGISNTKSLVKIKSYIEDNFHYKANIIAGFLLCSIFVCYTAILDIESCNVDINDLGLPSYYTHNWYFFGITISCMILYLLCFMIGVCWFGLEMLILVCFRQQEAVNRDDEEKPNKRIALSCVLIIGSALLSVVAHFPSILMAWATDPFYASRVALYYGIIIFCYFSTFYTTYIVTSKALSEDGELKLSRRLCFVLSVSLCASFIAVTAILAIIALYVISVPVNNSIETTAEGVTSIYDGVVVLIGGLVAYHIGWQYIGYSFSISDAVENAMGDMKTPPFGINRQEWEKATGEKRLTQIVKVIAENVNVQNLLKTGTQDGEAGTASIQ